jgi:hypothetical protein
MSKRSIILIAIIGVLVLGAVGAGYYYSSNITSTAETTHKSSKDGETTTPKSNFYFWVNSTGIWNGLIQGSNFARQDIQGSGSKFIETACSPSGTYKAVLHLQDKGHYLTVSSVWITISDKSVMTPEQLDKITHAQGLQRPIILKNETTSADFGTVTLSGTC